MRISRSIHIFFIHSSLNEHLGCFYVLAIVNSAAMNTGSHVSFKIRVFFFRFIPKSGIDMVILFLVF